MELSERVQRVKPSTTLALSARAASIKASGGDIINLSVGEPDFPTPPHICDAAKLAIQEGYTRYTPVDGIPALKDAIIQKMARDNNLTYQADQVMATNGGKQGLYNLCQAILNEDDEVIIPAPYWVSYPEMARLAGAVPVVVETDYSRAFKITPEQLATAITPKTRLIFLNSPSNPSGMAYSKDELAALGEVLLKHPQVFVATDDIYEYIQWTHQSFSNIINACPELTDRTLVLNAVSKTYAMTGWRLGYCTGPSDLIKAMKTIQSQSTSNPCSIAQYAAIAALTGDQQCVKDMVKAFRHRHDIMLQKLNDIPGIEARPADGTFYMFPDARGAMEALGFAQDTELAEHLLKKTGVTVVPGSAFGTPGCLRISFAAAEESLLDAMERLRTIITA